MDQTQKFLPEWLIVLGGAVVIGLFGIWMTAGISQYMDILLSDETIYLSGGLNFFERIPKGWGPSYSGWYKVLSFIEPDPIRLHYFNFKVLAIGLSILIYLSLYRLKVPVFMAFISGLFFLFADINMISWPRVSHFATCGILLALFLSTFLRSGYFKLLLFLFAGLMVTYARPEIGMSFNLLLLLTGAFVLFYRKLRLSKMEWVVTVALLPVFAVFFLKVGTPMVKVKGKPDFEKSIYPREVTAYGQHFYLRYMEENGILKDSMIFWDQIFRDAYEPRETLTKTFATNVPATVHHISYNIGTYFKRSFDYVSGIYLPDRILYLPLWLKLAVFIAGLAALIGIFGFKGYWQHIRDQLSEHYAGYGLTLLMTFPPILTSIIIYPRDHYLMILVPVYILLVSLLYLIHMTRGWDQKRILGGMALVSVLLIFLLPKPKDFEFFNLWQPRTGTVNMDAINKINSMGIDEPYTILLNEGNIDVYLDNPDVYSHVTYGNMGGLSFVQAVDTLNIKMVHFTSFLDHDPGMGYDTTWTNFLRHPETLNFERVETGSPFGYLLVHQSLLKQ